MKKWLETDSFEEAFDKFNNNMGEIDNTFALKANKQQGVWITPTLLNGWVNRIPSTPVRFRKNEFGRVEIEGAVKGGTLGAPVFVLPTGYRSGTYYPKVFGVINYAGTMAEVSISGSNFTIDKSSSTTWISLEGISYEPN